MGLFSRIKRAVKKVARSIKKVASFLVSPVATPFSTTQSIPQISNDTGPQQLDGTLLNFQGGSNKIPVIYGFRKVGGTRVFVSTNGTNNKYLYVAIVFCEGPIVGLSGLDPLWIDDTQVPLSSYDHGVVAEPTAGPYKDRLKVQFFDGRGSMNTSAHYSANYTDTGNGIVPLTGSQDGVFADIDGSGGAPGWTVDHQISGLAWYAMRFEWKKIDTQDDANNNPYKGIPQVKVRLHGKLIFDAQEIGSDHGFATGTSYLNDVANSHGGNIATGGTNRGSLGQGNFGDNPVSVLLDYLRNPDYGKGLEDNKIDFDSFRDSARQLQTTQQTVITPTFNGAIRMFTCPIYVDTGQSIMNNIKIILQSFRGMLPYSNGKYKCVLEGTEDVVIGNHLNEYSGNLANINTVKTFNNDNIVGGITIERPDRSTRLNRVRITFTDGIDQGATSEAIFPPDGSDYDALLTEDNGEKLESSFTIPWCTFEPRAHLFAQLLVRKSRNNTVISFATNLGASDLIPSNLITVVNTSFGINGPFRITDMTMSADGLIVITAIEHQPSIYVQDLNSFNALGTDPVLNLPNPFTVEQVGTPVLLEDAGITSVGIGKLLCTWSATTDPFLDRYHVQIKKESEPSSSFQTVGTTQDTKYLIDGLETGVEYRTRVFVENTLNRRSQAIFSNNARKVTPLYTPAGGSTTAVTTNKVTTSIGSTELGA